MDSDVSARVCKNSCLEIMFGVCLHAMTGKEFNVKVATCVALLQSTLCSDPECLQCLLELQSHPYTSLHTAHNNAWIC